MYRTKYLLFMVLFLGEVFLPLFLKLKSRLDHIWSNRRMLESRLSSVRVNFTDTDVRGWVNSIWQVCMFLCIYIYMYLVEGCL